MFRERDKTQIKRDSHFKWQYFRVSGTLKKIHGADLSKILQAKLYNFFCNQNYIQTFLNYFKNCSNLRVLPVGLV